LDLSCTAGAQAVAWRTRQGTPSPLPGSTGLLSSACTGSGNRPAGGTSPVGGGPACRVGRSGGRPRPTV